MAFLESSGSFANSRRRGLSRDFGIGRKASAMKRQASITIAGWLFIAAGLLGVAYHAGELDVSHPFDFDVVAAAMVRILAIVGGVFVLRGRNWARWLLIGWLTYHVGLSAFHSL